MDTYLFFNCPPSPYYLESGSVLYRVGETHPNRSNLNLFDLIIVKQGCLYLGEEEDVWEIKAGEGLILLPNKYHYTVKPVDKETVFYWVHFQTVSSWQQSDQSPILFQVEQHQQCFNPRPYTMKIAKHITLASPKQTYQLLEQMNDTQQLVEPKAYRQKQQTFEALLYLIDERQLQQHTSQLEKLAVKVELYIRNNYKQVITNDLLSQLFNYHYNYITRAMKHVYHYSPHEYVIKLRMEEAKVLLLHSFMPISAIAYKVGFEQTAYFTQCFRKFTSLSPTEFRKQYRSQ